MSSASTRTRILDAARRVLEADADPGVGLEQVARAAGVSRQAIYLHFGSRGALLLALAEHVDEVEGLARHARRVRQAPTGVEALARLVELNAEYEPRIRAVALAHDAARRTDPELEAAWQDRMARRLRLYREVVRRIDAESALAHDLTPREAVDLIWALLGSRVHEDLVRERGWSRKHYEIRMRALLSSVLLGAPE